MYNFQITKMNSEIFSANDKISMKRRRVYGLNFTIEQHPLRFKSWDDDGFLYFEGTCQNTESAMEAAADWTMWDSGCTRTKFYDRSTGAIIDEIS